MKAEEFFKEEYGHSYNLPLDSIEAIKFATRYAATQEGGECYVWIDCKVELPEESACYDTSLGEMYFTKEEKLWGTEGISQQPYKWLKRILPQISEGEMVKIMEKNIKLEYQQSSASIKIKGFNEAAKAITQLMKGSEG